MTSDAKVGLLLGLVFIIIIAFVINGLPDCFQPDDKKVATGINARSDHGGIFDKADEAVRRVQQIEYSYRPVPSETPDEKVRYSQKLPDQNRSLRKNFSPLPEPIANRPKTYVVQSGDNLAVIAKKFYGDDEGNKRTIIQKLFKFNKGVLSAQDSILVGQKLTIPPIALLLAEPAKAEGLTKKTISVSGVLKKVKDFGNRKYTEIKSTIGTKKSTRAEYIVHSGDTLWDIADRHLGGGNRYLEILKLNRGTIDDAEDICEGMRLRLPAR